MSKRIWVIVILSLLGIYYVSPTLIYFSLPKDKRNDVEVFNKAVPSFLPKNHIKLGLDLQGGVQLVLGVNTDEAVDNKLSRIGVEVVRWAKDAGIKVKTAYVLKGKQTLRVELEEDQDPGDFKEKLFDEYPGLRQVARNGHIIDFAYSEEQMKRIKASAVEQAERIVRSRIDKWGVAEPLINRRVDGSILVQLPGFSDPEKAKELLGRTAQLKFKIVDDAFHGFDSLRDRLPEGVRIVSQPQKTLELQGPDKKVIEQLLKPLVPADRELLFEEIEIAGGTRKEYRSYLVHAATEVDGEDILDAYVSRDSRGLTNEPIVALRFTGPGGKRFEEVTGANVKKRLAIILDDVVVSAPTIQTKISGGTATITLGSGSMKEKFDEAQQLAMILKSGALPARIDILEERQVGASLGPELAEQGVRSILVGLVLVLIYMIAYYRLPGLVACVALILNAIFLLALMAGFGFALTLPGIAGFVLTLGMAVDANVLINERIRQELREGRHARKAVENGFAKVFSTIIDANVTTLIAALVLFETNSSGPIKGFSVTLMIGLTVSLFTSLYCTRGLFDFFLRSKTSDTEIRNWFGGKRALRELNLNIDFLRWGSAYTVIVGLISVAVIGVAVARGGLNWSVDFAGGTEMEVSFAKDVDAGELRKVILAGGVNNLTIQAIEGRKDRYILRFDKGDESEAAKSHSMSMGKRIVQEMAQYGPRIDRVDFVGPQVGSELRNQGFLSVFFALLGVLIYIFFRFDLRFGPGAIVKMIFDVLLILGFYVFAWRSFDLTSIAALLTVVGYSVNDTIVIYDRIRENLILHPKRTLYENINISINETLSRTINTSVTTILSLIGVLIFGTAQIWNFAAAMGLGVLVATLSSIFLASSFILWVEDFRKGKKMPLKSAANIAGTH